LWRRGGNEWIQHRCNQAIPGRRLSLPDNHNFSATPEAYANELLLWLFGIRFAADSSQRKESPMKTELSLLAALLVLAIAIYASGLIMLSVYIFHSFWHVTAQADPVLVLAVYSIDIHRGPKLA